MATPRTFPPEAITPEQQALLGTTLGLASVAPAAAPKAAAAAAPALGFLRTVGRTVAASPFKTFGLVGLAAAVLPGLIAAAFPDEGPPGPEGPGVPSRDLLERQRLLAETRQRETQTRLLEADEARRQVEFERSSFVADERERQAVVARQADAQARLDLERERTVREAEALATRAAAELLAQQRELAVRREEAQLRAAVERQDATALAFARFAQTLPLGATVGVDPQGNFIPIPAGSGLTAADVARGVTPLPLTPEQTTAQRITTVPGVFVGPSFQYKTIEAAQRALRGLPPL